MTQYSGGSVPMPQAGTDDEMVTLKTIGTVIYGPSIFNARIEIFTFKVPRRELENYDIDEDGIATRKWGL